MSATVPEGSGSTGMPGSNRRLQQTQAQVDEVVDIMRVNVDKVLERDQKLSELDDRADALQAGASQFETSAAKLKRKYWWKNCKMWAILIAVILTIIIIIISKYQNRIFLCPRNIKPTVYLKYRYKKYKSITLTFYVSVNVSVVWSVS
uniref:V-SNARE coiled-coil homology domain-containing protein n=3 Tax=Euteleostomi TaxID=117571 RepID=A0A3B3T2E6_9TELE